ncbi:XRE family transcriptional regulator [bacterium]|nr:XRE family transcriptional regulator [bacterium]
MKSRRNSLEERSENIIENARLSKGISQRELAKLLGISRNTLNDLLLN